MAADHAPPTATAHYGPDIPTEAELRLCGDVRRKRVLELGCGPSPAAVAFAHQGAVAIAVDTSADDLTTARRLCEREGVRVEFHHGDLADLAFVRADSIDLAFSANALARVPDLGRVFRQVHRVLKPNAHLVLSVPHPASHLLEEDDAGELAVRRSWFDRSPVTRGGGEGGAAVTVNPHTFSDLFTQLARANFRVDAVVEPEPRNTGPRSPQWRDAYQWVPPTLVLRARKEGI